MNEELAHGIGADAGELTREMRDMLARNSRAADQLIASSKSGSHSEPHRECSNPEGTGAMASDR